MRLFNQIEKEEEADIWGSSDSDDSNTQSRNKEDRSPKAELKKATKVRFETPTGNKPTPFYNQLDKLNNRIRIYRSVFYNRVPKNEEHFQMQKQGLKKDIRDAARENKQWEVHNKKFMVEQNKKLEQMLQQKRKQAIIKR